MVVPVTLVSAVIMVAALAGSGRGAAAQSADGKQQYETYCASCHGSGGRGDGTFAKTLKRRPADLTQLARRNKGEFPREEVARLIDGRSLDEAHKKSDMPIWGDVFSKSGASSDEAAVKARIDALVRHVERIQEQPKG